MAKKAGLGIIVKDKGIATILNHMQLMVPPNQRPYAWTDSYVRTLYEDLSSAIRKGDEAYFLGTIVLTQGTGPRLEVADGQQRLATTSILIAAIRDYLEVEGENAEKKAANSLMSDFLLKYELKSGENIPKLELNYEDREYFIKRVLLAPDEPERTKIKPTTLSHERLDRAADIAKEHVQKVVSQFSKTEGFKQLYAWIEFLQDNALVIEIQVPEDINAFTMFETLNDRGLKASQIDILKNALFSLAVGKVTEVQVKWASMTSTIDSVGDADLLLTYVRHFWSTQYGYVVERELAVEIKKKVTTKQQAINFITELEEYAADYVGLLTPLEYMGWPNLDQKTRAYIYIITRILKIEQIRPLLLAIVKNFEPDRAKVSLKMLLSWSVRFLVAGTGGGGPLDRAYMQAAKDVMEGTIKTAKQLKEKSGSVITRSDKDFKEAFAKARATKNDLARYYLRALEQYQRNLKSPGVDSEPELGDVLDHTDSFNLEHVLPLSTSKDWENISLEIAQQYTKRIGNMALVNPDKNVKLGNKAFTEKVIIYNDCPQLLTQAIAEYDNWGPEQIEDRQAKLAELAVKVWDQ